MSHAITHPRKLARQVAQKGRHGDTMLAHLGPSDMALLKRLGGSGTRNPKTGLPEFFSFSDLLPIAASLFGGGIGSGIGEALGLSGAIAPVVGNAIFGGGIGGLTGGGRGALRGALTGGLTAAAAPILGNAFADTSLGDKFGVEGGKDTVFGRGFGGLTSGETGSGAGTEGADAAAGESAYEAAKGGISPPPPPSGQAQQVTLSPSSTNLSSIVSNAAPSIEMEMPDNVAGIGASTSGAGGVSGGYSSGDYDQMLANQTAAKTALPEWAATAPAMAPRSSAAIAPEEKSWLEKNKIPLMLGGGMMLLSGARKPQQQGATTPPSIAQSRLMTAPLDKVALNRRLNMPTNAQLQNFGAGGGSTSGRFFDTPNAFIALADGGKVAKNDNFEKMDPFEKYREYKKPGFWRGDEIKPNGKPSSRTASAIEELQSLGRNGDTVLAHINPQEAMLLRLNGGAGTINPYTGLPEFYDSEAGMGSEGSGTTTEGASRDTVGGTADPMGTGKDYEAGVDNSFDGALGGVVGDKAMPSYAEDRGFFGRIGDNVMANIQDMMARPVETLANLALGVAIPGYTLANAVYGIANPGNTLAGKGIEVASSLASGAPSNPAAVAGVGAIDNQVANTPSYPGGNNAQQAAQAAGAPAAQPNDIGNLSAIASGDANALNGYGRTAFDMSNVDLTNFGAGGNRAAGTFFDNPGMQAMSEGGDVDDGISDGRTDDIPAKLSHGEHVIDAETVSLLGNGDNDAGHARLEQMKAGVRKQKGQKLAKGKISPNAKSPLRYMKAGIAA